MKKIVPILLVVILMQGCATAEKKPRIMVIDSGAYGKFTESELASVSGCRNDGENVYINKVHGKETSPGFFDGWPDTIKLPPGKHHLEIYYSDSRFSLRTDLKSFSQDIIIEVEKSHKYEICISVEKSGLLAATIRGWIEDKTTGKRLGLTK